MEAKIRIGARLILGLIYFVFGLNGFLQFMPAPPLPESAVTFVGGLAGSGYFLPVLGATQTICGLLLLSGFAAPLALVILAPITLQIILFHAFLTPGLQNLVLPLIMVVLHVTAASAYRRIYRPLFSRGK